MKKRSFPRRPASARPRKPDPGARSPGPSYPALDFAVKFDMLTDEEIEACKRGNACIKGSQLLNLNSPLGFATGTIITLYQGRRFDVLADRLLGLDQDRDD